LASTAKGTSSLWTRAALNRRALTSNLISRPSAFAATNGSVPSISIVISRPARRTRTGTDKIWVSSSVTLGNGIAETSSSALSRGGLRHMSIWSTPTSIRSIRAVRTARLRVTGNSGQLFPFVGEFLATFKDYPPRQKAASFTVDQVLQSLQQNNGGN
jgi:hypothetical protein